MTKKWYYYRVISLEGLLMLLCCVCHLSAVPNTLDVSQQNGVNSRKKKRRKRRPNEGMGSFSSAYELTEEILGVGAWSKVVTCRNKQTSKKYAVKVSCCCCVCCCCCCCCVCCCCYVVVVFVVVVVMLLCLHLLDYSQEVCRC